MANFSKPLPYTCYELGHCWTPSCSVATFEVGIIGFIESCKIYGVVYLLTTLIKWRKINLKYGIKVLKDYVRSVCFLTVNAFGYIGSFCVIRHVLRFISFFSASFAPAVVASVMAISVERPERRAMLAIYVTNVASESLWYTAVANGYARPIPRGELLIFVAAMTVLGYSYRSTSPIAKMLNSILQLFWGRGESGEMIAARQEAAVPDRTIHSMRRRSMVQKFLQLFKGRHEACPHRLGCFPNFVLTAGKGFGQGFLLQLAIRLLPSLGSVIRSPGKLYSLVTSRTNLQAGLFLAWFTAVFKGTCCVGRWWSGKENASHGAVAGALSALSMYFYSAPSLALYIMWKTLEGLYEKGCNDGYLPRIPYSVEALYTISTAYLFHTAVLDCHNMKPSYWRFLNRLTWGRMSDYNRHLLAPYGLDSGKIFGHYWPKYDLDHVTEGFKLEFQDVIARGKV